MSWKFKRPSNLRQKRKFLSDWCNSNQEKIEKIKFKITFISDRSYVEEISMWIMWFSLTISIQMRSRNIVMVQKKVPVIICLPEMFQPINFREPENQSRFKTRPLSFFLLDLVWWMFANNGLGEATKSSTKKTLKGQ